jgi:hypothetical protein
MFTAKVAEDAKAEEVSGRFAMMALRLVRSAHA